MNSTDNFRLGCVAVVLALIGTAPASAEEHVVQAQATKFSPAHVFIQPGDTVTWANMAGHDSQAEEGLVPEGAETWHIGMGENGSVTLDVEGVYLYKCTPHFALGMAGAIVVGKPTNIDAIKQNAKGMYKRVIVKMMKSDDWPDDMRVSSK